MKRGPRAITGACCKSWKAALTGPATSPWSPRTACESARCHQRPMKQVSLPFAFTEHGAIIAATVLNTPQAIDVISRIRLRESHLPYAHRRPNETSLRSGKCPLGLEIGPPLLVGSSRAGSTRVALWRSARLSLAGLDYRAGGDRSRSNQASGGPGPPNAEKREFVDQKAAAGRDACMKAAQGPPNTEKSECVDQKGAAGSPAGRSMVGVPP